MDVSVRNLSFSAQSRFVVQACQEPYHREALGYDVEPPNDHPERFIARRENRIILNLVDVDNIEITKDIVAKSIQFINDGLNQGNKVLIHCNMGMSRSASIALMYLATHGEFIGLTFQQAQGIFAEIYPPYLPGGGISRFIENHWNIYNPPLTNPKKKVVFIDNTAHHLLGQQHLFKAFLQDGYDITIMCPYDRVYSMQFKKLRVKYQPVEINGKGINPIQDYSLVKVLKHQFAQLKPDIICSFTIKPNLYASIAARELNIPIIPNITGLGYVFTSDSSHWLLKNIVKKLYRFALKHVKVIFFQNNDDKNILYNLNVFPVDCNLVTLPGDGVDLNKFKYVGYTQTQPNSTKFLYSGRLLWDKGLGELIEAMKIVKIKYPNTTLTIIGNYFEGNPSAISEDDIQQWQNNKLCNYLGMIDNVADIIKYQDCVVLPSYREGLPRALLEASAMGKPIITVDSVGCRDAIIPDVTGLMCAVKDANSLATTMLKFIELDSATKQQMGQSGRNFMIDKFDQKIVVQQYISLANGLIKL